MTDAAMRFNGSTRNWSVDANGVLDTIHPVDQQVALSVLVPQGAIKSSPTTGSTLRNIRYLGTQNLNADVDARVRESNPLARLLAAGQVRLDRIDVDTSSGKLAVAVYYVNLVTQQKNKVQFSGA